MSDDINPTAQRSALNSNQYVGTRPSETLGNVNDGLSMLSAMIAFTDFAEFSGNEEAMHGLHQHFEGMRAALSFEQARLTTEGGAA